MNNKQDKYKENHFLAYHSQTAGDQKKKKKISLKACSKKKKKKKVVLYIWEQR